MRAKTRRRLILAVVPLLGLGGLLVYARRERGLDEAARSAREKGLADFDDRDYRGALDHLSTFIRRLDPDALALMRYGQAIRRIVDPDARHLDSAIASLRRSVALAPESAEARGELLELYLDVGLRTEAIEQADWFLARDAHDERALRAKAVTLAEMKQYDRALAVFAGAVPPESPLLELHLLHLGVLARLEKPGSEILARAEAVQKAHPTDPTFRLVVARARLLADDRDGAKQILGVLIPLAKGDPRLARLLLPDLDAAGSSHQAVELLASLPPRSLEPAFQVELVRRAWESGQPSVVADNVAGWGAAPEALSSSVIGYHVLALRKLGRVENARRGFAVLQQRAEQDVAKGWVRLIEGVVLPEAPTVAARIEACVQAIAADGNNPQSHFELGLAYRDADEVDLAARELRTAASLSRGWADPVVLGVRLLAENGRLPAALHAAVDARVRGSDDPAVAILVTMAKSARDETSGGTFAERLLAGLGRSSIPPRETLAIRLATTAAAGKADAARDLIREAIAMDPAPEGDVLLACGQLSEALGLGLEVDCTSRYEQVYGNTPSLALTLARRAAAASGPAQGLETLRSRRKTAGGERSPVWLAVEATYLEGRGDSDEALRAWRELATTAGEDPTLLRTILSSPSSWKDRPFVRAVVDRLKVATGPSCTWWRYHDARWLLSGPKPDVVAIDGAIERLKGILEVAPEHGRARVLLANTYELRGDAKKALEQWIVARGTAGSTFALELRVARLHLALGDWGSARDTLERLRAGAAVPSARGGSEAHAAMAAMFAQLGDKDSVLLLLKGLPEDPALLDEVRGRAELFAFAGEFQRAERMIGAELTMREDPRSLLLAAALADFQGHPKAADALLERLASSMPDPLARERMLAGHFRRVEDLPRAEVHLRRSVEAAGAGPADWTQLLVSQVIRGESAAALDTLRQAEERGVFPKTGTAGALVSDVLRVSADRVDLRDLGAAYVQEPERRDVTERAIRLLEGADRSEPSATHRAQLLALAHSHPKFLPLQMATVDLLMRRGEFEDALGVCKTAAAALPMSPEPYRAMAYCHRAMGQPRRAEEAVKAWRSRAAGLPLEPDLFLAQQSSPSESVALLERHVARALSRGVVDVLAAYGEALILDGATARAESTLAPHLASSAAARRAWVRLAGLLASRGEATTAVAWLERPEIRDLERPETDLRLDLASAWQFVASTGRPEARVASRRQLDALPADASLAAKDWERIGLIHEANGDVGKAEEAYRKTTSSDPRPLVALNNLAMILLRSDRAGEALPLATHLVAARPDVAEYRDTLAAIQIGAGDLPGALTQFEAARRLEPTNAAWALRITQALLDGGDAEGARGKYKAFRRDYPEGQMPSEVRSAWIELGRRLDSAPQSNADR